MSGGKKGFVVSSRPRKYKETPQQRRLREAAEYCEIRKGMSREELLDKMTNCIPTYFKKAKQEGQDDTPAPSS
jgi:hypothetical protein